ncbi:MAG: Tn3 family transposase [Chloroflexota bacterium]|nr:Tn3 family transposase [Chloroflexota bacterium]
MPARFLTDAERERLSSFPPSIPAEDLIGYYTLFEADLGRVRDRRGDHNLLGYALALGTLAYLGYCPDDLTQAPAEAVRYVADQLSIDPSVLPMYAERNQTRTDHLREIQEYLDFRNADEEELEALLAWLVERALEHDKPTLLLGLACEKLRVDRVVRPGLSRLKRLVGTARERAVGEMYRRLSPLLAGDISTTLDRLLVREARLKGTPLGWLREGATANTPTAIRGQIEKLHFLRRLGVPDWDVSSLSSNRLKLLSQLGKRDSNQALQRMSMERRYPILLAFLHQAYREITDEVIDLFDRCLGGAYSRAARDLDEFRKGAARSTNEKVLMFRDIGRIVLDPDVPDAALREAIHQYLPKEMLRAKVEETERLVRPLDDSYFDLLGERYNHIRAFSPAFLDAFEFRSNLARNPLLQAVELLRQMNSGRRRKVPEGAPMEFVGPKWKPYVVDSAGAISRKYYELSVLWELRGSLRSGDVWLDGSRRYADPETYLISPERWPRLREEVCSLVQGSPSGEARLQECRRELEEGLAALDKTLAGEGKVRVADGDLVLSPLKAEELPESTVLLRQLVAERLPRVELADLLVEVDDWTGFTRHLEHAGGATPRAKDIRAHLFASIFAQACNFGVTTMAELADLSYDRLAWATEWYLREDTLDAAVASIVNYQHRLPLSAAWGGGTLSSSDGQRFAVSVQARNATALPRYFGLGRGLTYYTWTSDQFSQYGSKVIPATVRDATYVLDEILDNETELPIEEHTTDSTGFTELVFALFDLLGLQFSPRIRDLGDQRLYRLEQIGKYEHAEQLLKGTINTKLILSRWDDLLRVAGSLKLGWVTSSLLVGKLQSFPRQNALTRALQEYGRLIKTIFILRYLESEEYRRRINGQLNKGESLHALRRFIFFANEGQIRKRQPEEQGNQASSLNLVTNAVITWNTVYMAEAIRQLKDEGYEVGDQDLAHLSPTLYDHINPYGKYSFDSSRPLDSPALRPLRQSSSSAR